jgi:hypothetical protein
MKLINRGNMHPWVDAKKSVAVCPILRSVTIVLRDDIEIESLTCPVVGYFGQQRMRLKKKARQATAQSISRPGDTLATKATKGVGCGIDNFAWRYARALGRK